MRLTQHDVAACREAYSQYDGDAARLRAMLAAAHQDAPDDVVLDLCSQVALQRPLHAVAETALPAGGAGAAGGAGDAASGSASFEMLLRVVEQQARSEDDAEEDSLLAFISLGGGSDKTGFVSSDRMKAVCKDFGLLVDIDEFMQQTDGAPDSLDYNRFKELLAR